MRFPRVARLDDTDEHVYERAAAVGEPAVPGTFQFSFSERDPRTFEGKEKQAFRHGFLGTRSFGRCTVVTVSELAEAEYKSVVEALAWHMVEVYGAPSLDEALPVARKEAEYAAGLCEEGLDNALLAIERTATADGAIQEAFKTVQPRANWDGGDVRIWRIEEDG